MAGNKLFLTSVQIQALHVSNLFFDFNLITQE